MQTALDFYDAGVTMLRVHVRDLAKAMVQRILTNSIA
jgi:hypothetical protein